jgi:hypothetical protein
MLFYDILTTSRDRFQPLRDFRSLDGSEWRFHNDSLETQKVQALHVAHMTSGTDLFAPDTFTSLFPLSPSLYSKVETADCKSAVKAMIVVHTARSYSQISTADRSVTPRSVAIATQRKLTDVNPRAVARRARAHTHTHTQKMNVRMCV